MSQELAHVYIINLGKVSLSPNNRRAKRAINMIREFTIRHFHTSNIKINPEINLQIWEKGIRNPPKKLRVLITKKDDGTILVSKYVYNKQETKPTTKQETKPTTKQETKPTTKQETKPTK